MKKRVVLFIVLVMLVSASAFVLPPPSGPFTAFTSTTTGSGSFSLQPPDNPFTNTATSTATTLNTSNTSNATGGTGSTGTSGTGSTATNGTSSSSSSTSSGTSGGGSRGGGGGGMIRIDLSGDPVIRTIPVGRTIQFSKNGRYYPSLLFLKKIDAKTRTASWSLDAKFYDIPVSSSKTWDLSRDNIPDVVFEVLNVDRTSVMVKASVPRAASTPAPATRPAPVSQPAPYPSQAKQFTDCTERSDEPGNWCYTERDETGEGTECALSHAECLAMRARAIDPSLPAPEPVYQEPVLQPDVFVPEIIFVEEVFVSWFPVRTVAIVVGILLLVGLTACAIKRKYSAPRTLTEYIKQGLNAGHLENEIRTRLERAGWKKDEINASMRVARRKNI